MQIPIHNITDRSHKSQLLLGGADLAEEVGWNDGGELFLLQPVHVQAPHHVLHAGCRTRLNNFKGTVSRNE
jgi:hypothetical protein